MSSSKNQRNKNEALKSVSIQFTAHGWDDYCHWEAMDREILRHIKLLIQACLRDPFKGIGKPKALVGDLKGLWSRRITHKDRLVYSYTGGVLTILQCRDHY